MYVKNTEYYIDRHYGLKNGILISNAPFVDDDKEFMKRNTMTVVYSEKFLEALKEHTNLHIIGRIKSE